MSYFAEVQSWFAATGPKLFAALSILVAMLLIAKALSWVVSYLIDKTNFGKHAKQLNSESFGKTAGNAVFWLVILVTLPALLGALDLQSMLGPVQALSDKVIGFLPNLIAAALILAIGWIVATIVRKATTGVLKATRVDSLSERYAIGDPSKAIVPSNVIGLVAFALIILPVGISTLDALAIEAVSVPGKRVLLTIMSAIPNIVAAAILIALAYAVAKFAASIVEQLLAGTGFDRVLATYGLGSAKKGDNHPSFYAGQIAGIAIVIFALIEAAKLLDFAILSTILTELVTLGGRIIMGLIIIGFGSLIAGRLAQFVKQSSETQSALLADFVRFGIIALTTAMGLRQMGLADEIIIAAFVGLIGAASVSAALAFGLGGRDVAGRVLENWSDARKDKKTKSIK